MRIPTLLQKISELSARPETRTAIDVDLMLDYTRVLYADLLEWRSKLPATVAKPEIKEPSLAELTSVAQREPAKAEAINGASMQPKVEIPMPVPAAESVTSEPKIVFPQSIPAPTSGRDIRSMISINDKYQIMSELFGNDKNAYEQALDYINQSGGEHETMEWLREQLWITEEHTDAAQSFYDIVGRFFRN